MGVRWRVFTLTAILVAMTLTVIVVSPPSGGWNAPRERENKPSASLTAASAEEVITFQRPDGGVIQLLQGSKARARLDELKAGHKRAGWLRAERSLMSRGLIATEIVTVIRHIPASEIVGGRDPVAVPTSLSAPQDFEETINGKEIVMWSWDDGDDDTWEGTVQITRISDGAYLTWDMQIEIPTPTTYDRGDWWDIDDYGTEEGSECPEDPGEGCPIEVSFSPSGLKSENRAPVVLVSGGTRESACPTVPFVCQVAVWVGSNAGRRERARQFAVCSGVALLTAGGGCARSGSGWPACAGLYGGVGVGGCAAYQLFDYLTGGEP